MLPILFETRYDLYLAVPQAGLPLYLMYIKHFFDEWECWYVSSGAINPVGNPTSTLVSRDRVFTLMERHHERYGFRKVPRLEALIKYGFVTE